MDLKRNFFGRNCLARWWEIAAVACAVLTPPALAGESYLDPDGGWRYVYDGIFNPGVVDENCLGGVCPPGYGNSSDEEALDGTWMHDQSDKWDGSGPGEIGPIPEGDAPGGVEALFEDTTSYVRLQDTGNPELPGHGWIQGPMDPVNNNRRIFLGHKIEDDGPLPSELVLDNGITFSIRARIPAPTLSSEERLDNLYISNDENEAIIRRWFATHPADFNQNGIVDNADFTVWRDTNGSTYDLRADADDGSGMGVPDGVVDQFDFDYAVANFGATADRVGRGHPLSNDGRGMFNIVQNNPNFFNADGSIGFSLITSADIELLCGDEPPPNVEICETPEQSGGLIMNHGSGTSSSGSSSVDTLDPGTLNLLEFDDAALAEWHEFWITIEADGVVGTHTVKVYADGSTDFTEFHVTKNQNGDSEYIDDAWLTMGLSDTGLFGSFDVDFFAYSLGIIEPVPAVSVPEPASATLLMLMMLLASLRRLRS